MRRKDIMIGNFLGGLAWGLGSVLGATLVVGLLLWLLHLANVVPVLGGFVGQVMQDAQQTQLKSSK